jgi:hypothetical protein
MNQLQPAKRLTVETRKTMTYHVAELEVHVSDETELRVIGVGVRGGRYPLIRGTPRDLIRLAASIFDVAREMGLDPWRVAEEKEEKPW